MRSFLQRPNYFFISYSHKDAPFAKVLKDWISETAGLRVWFDQLDLRSGESVQTDIATSISQCQGIIFVLSKNSLASQFVQDELNQALAEKKQHSRFQIVLLRIDDCDIASQWKAVRHLKWHELATADGPKLSLHAAAEILCRTHSYDGWERRQAELKEVYVSRGWRDGDEAFADEICRHLAVRGLRLVGDLPDQDKNDPQRIAGIMQGCWGHVLVLPRRSSGGGPEAAYKYFQQEKDLSEKLGVPRAVFAEPECALPPALAEQAHVIHSELVNGKLSVKTDLLRDHVEDFVEGLRKPSSEVHAFFASEYRGNQDRNVLARAIVEATGTLPCYWGKDYRDMNIQGCIRDAITSAKFVVANLTSPNLSPDSPAGGSHANVNACIEAAIAWGANVRVLFLAATNSPGPQMPEEGKTRHIPFMFRSAQLDLYGDSISSLAPGVEFLGAVHKTVLEDRKRFGRRVINFEL
ncbi:MAG: toll/interleukin-1 receptor domain-containing protein [Pirellulaceae bacterium]|nr:toll/interleukin-1 receptor domain-containing protein [Pirellulaceae bacterium]